MTITFMKYVSGFSSKNNTVYLISDNWDDFSYKTTFSAKFFDANGTFHNLGQLKIGYINQPHGRTDSILKDEFTSLDETFFSLGQGTEFYQSLSTFKKNIKEEILIGLRDIVFDDRILNIARAQSVFNDSLLRGVNISTISDQFKRVLNGGAILTEFHFSYNDPATAESAGFELQFDIYPNGKPNTNVHVLIGRNGVGKTTLLNNMIAALIPESMIIKKPGSFIDTGSAIPRPISKTYFSGLISVSFSAFDPFTPPKERNSNNDELRYSYVGLKGELNADGVTRRGHKDAPELSKDFVLSIVSCFGIDTKRDRWENAIKFLESDTNFKEMDLLRLTSIGDQSELEKISSKVFGKMSSGHAIVLLTITKIIERADEKTLIIMDEPESHLHPPLLSAFTRALSDLLQKINGIAIIATHSPVVLQEVPKSCVWKLYRTRLASSSYRPEMETFAENVGTLTREVFSLEVSSSGFHELLSESVLAGGTYEQILEEYNQQIGFEGKALLRAMIGARSTSGGA